jgi:hypothetical protein
VSENIGLRIHLAQGLNDLLAASHSDQPVMNDCDLHQIPFTELVEVRKSGRCSPRASSKPKRRKPRQNREIPAN